MVLILFAISCSQCKDHSDCVDEIEVTNLSSEPKIVWLSLLFPDTTYQCEYQRNGVGGNAKIKIPFARGLCWNSVLSSTPLQVFVIDSIVYEDSTCDAIQANPQWYHRMEFTLDELKRQNWVVSVD
jgi:hypothetical protein